MTRAQRASLPTLEQRISQAAKMFEQQARTLPPGPGRNELLRRARELDRGTDISALLSSSEERLRNKID